MENKELLDKIKKINNYINNSHEWISETERLLLKTMKLTEEVWELYSEILINLNFTRKWKVWNNENLKMELADVIITTLVIAADFWIDIEEQIWKKIDIIYDRFNLN
jgi:NTP pyrophosphatase (non-canonical NTP hydrolase)